VARDANQLVCPNCGASYHADQRFCASCNIPLTYSSPAEDEASERHRRARKVKPQLAEGQLVRVVGARNQAEAEFIQSLLLEEGVPSVLRRSAGFDVPDFLAAGPRDILVPESGVPTARQVLLQAELVSETPQRVTVSPTRLLASLLLALLVGALVVWGISQLAG
jgi:ribosomal protein L37E